MLLFITNTLVFHALAALIAFCLVTLHMTWVYGNLTLQLIRLRKDYLSEFDDLPPLLVFQRLVSRSAAIKGMTTLLIPKKQRTPQSTHKVPQKLKYVFHIKRPTNLKEYLVPETNIV